jgi:hypothetical protein
MMAETRPQFVTSLVTISQGRMAPAAGGVGFVRWRRNSLWDKAWDF